jgi:hypothetical protein
LETSTVEAQRAPEPLVTALIESCKEIWSRPAWRVAAHHMHRALALLGVARRIGVQLSAQETPASSDAKVINEVQRLSELLSHASARAKLHADRGPSDDQSIDGALEGWIACRDGSFTLPFEAPAAPAGFLRLDLRVTRVVDGEPRWGWRIASDPTRARSGNRLRFWPWRAARRHRVRHGLACGSRRGGRGAVLACVRRSWRLLRSFPVTTAPSEAARRHAACSVEVGARVEPADDGSATDPSADGSPLDVMFFDHVSARDRARVLRVLDAVAEIKDQLVRGGAADQSFMRAAQLLAEGADVGDLTGASAPRGS